jgi:hypothetical protein
MRLTVLVAATVLLVVACGFNPTLVPPAGVGLILGLVLWVLWPQREHLRRTVRAAGSGRRLALAASAFLLAGAIATGVWALYADDPAAALVVLIVASALGLATRALLFGSQPSTSWSRALRLTLALDGVFLLGVWVWLVFRGLSPVFASAIVTCFALGVGLGLLATSPAPATTPPPSAAAPGWPPAHPEQAVTGWPPPQPGQAVAGLRRDAGVLAVLFPYGVLALGVLVLALQLLGSPNGTAPPASPPPLTLTPRYEGTATHRGTEWEVTDRIVFDPDSAAELPPTSTQQLEGQGWRWSRVGPDMVFVRGRRLEAKVGWYPPTANSRLPITLPATIWLGRREIRFAPGERSRLTLISGRHVIAATVPAASAEIAGATEVRRLDLIVAAGEQTQVDLQMVSPLFRNDIGVGLANATVGGVVKWFLLAGMALFAQEIKQAIAVPLVRRLLHRLPIPAPAGEGHSAARQSRGNSRRRPQRRGGR